MTRSPERLPLSRTRRTAARVARSCADEASRIILDRFGRREQMLIKGRGNFVTATDLAVEEAVLTLLKEEYPGHSILSEETSGRIEEWDEGWLWVVDPLDGTHNYSQGIPNFAFNIALCRDGVPLLALTRAPVSGQEFFAVRGGGLTVNGVPASAAETPSLAQSVLGVDLGYDDERAAGLIALIAELWPGVQSVRIMGSAALGLAFAASARFDLFVHHFLFPWDVAPGILLVHEGGGVVVDCDGGSPGIRSRRVIAGAPAPVRDFLALAKERNWR